VQSPRASIGADDQLTVSDSNAASEVRSAALFDRHEALKQPMARFSTEEVHSSDPWCSHHCKLSTQGDGPTEASCLGCNAVGWGE
jgi:hypothetical protein